LGHAQRTDGFPYLRFVVAIKLKKVLPQLLNRQTATPTAEGNYQPPPRLRG
jgi:hypothetical protein